MMNAYDAHIDANVEARLEELVRFCAQPSVSAEGVGIDDCAALLTEMLASRGVRVERIETPGAPVIYGEIGEGERTILLYNHYDVVPPGPLDLWDSRPFEPVLRDGKLYARGAADNKGNIVARLAALDAYLAVSGTSQLKVKFLIEGEEEMGSKHLPAVVAAHADELRSDGCLWETGGPDLDDRPTCCFGLRGAVGVELRVQTLSEDAHSGVYSYLPNAGWRLVWALSTIKAPDERILIDGFEAEISAPSSRLRHLIDALPMSRAHDAARKYGVSEFAGGISAHQVNEVPLHSSINIAGLTAGYQGSGMMRIIPHAASCKLDLRLAPEQDPQVAVKALRAHLNAHGFGDVELHVFDSERGVMADPDQPFIRLVADAATQVYLGAPLLFPCIGGGGPMYPFVEHLAVPIAAAGVTYPGASAHAPNEHIRLTDWIKGARHTVRIFDGCRTDR